MGIGDNTVNKLSALGGLVAISGLILVMFKMIGAVTGSKFSIADSNLLDVISPDKLEQIDNLTNGFLHACASNIVAMPLYLHLIIFGTILLMISGLISK